MNEATHDELLAIFRKYTSDFTPWGFRDRDQGGADCSCGCRFFHVLEGRRGGDWGVCFCPQSPRRGLLTFEHQGCLHFEAEEETE